MNILTPTIERYLKLKKDTQTNKFKYIVLYLVMFGDLFICETDSLAHANAILASLSNSLNLIYKNENTTNEHKEAEIAGVRNQLIEDVNEFYGKQYEDIFDYFEKLKDLLEEKQRQEEAMEISTPTNSDYAPGQ